MKSLTNFSKLLAASFQLWLASQASFMAAALAYYSMFAIVALLALIITVIAGLRGPDAINQNIAYDLRHAADPGTIDLVQAAVIQAHDQFTEGWVRVVSVSLFIYAVFNWSTKLQDSLDHIAKYKVKLRENPISWILRRLPAFFLVAGLGIMLTTISLNRIIISIFFHLGIHPALDLFSIFISFLTSTTLLVLSLTLIYRIVPTPVYKLRYCFFGGLTASVMLLIASQIIELMLSLYRFPSFFGAASAVIIYLYWLFYISQIILFGMAIVVKSQNQKS